jgi:beta-galactosidase
MLKQIINLVLVSQFLGLAVMAEEAQVRERLLMDGNWRFMHGSANNPKLDFDFGLAFSHMTKQREHNPVLLDGFPDSASKSVGLPHDWGMSLPFNSSCTSISGYRPLDRNFPENSIGWYQRKFEIPAGDEGRRIVLEFEGVCQECLVFVNGVFMGAHHSSFTSFQFDITDAVNYGGKNVVVVRVDASKSELWCYPGAGIYRNVWLIKTAPVHVAAWGTQILTQVQPDVAKVTARTQVRNESDKPAEVVVKTDVLDGDGKTVASAETAPKMIAPGDCQELTPVMDVAQPKLWSVESPSLYRMVTTVKAGGVKTDTTETPFGIRTIEFDPDKGFILNGQRVKIKGFCDHQQHAGVGIAVPDALWDWRLKKLQEMGANAIRISHNPAPPALLDACDRLGILVMAEQRLFSSGAEGMCQLESMVKRDRNHPSIIIWSAGNEEGGVQDDQTGARIMKSLQDAFHRLDPSRRVTYAANNGGCIKGANAVAEVRGINYLGKDIPANSNPAATLDKYHAKYPRQPIIGTEDGLGGDIAWAMEKDYYSGVFIWTGFAYFGESTWPSVSDWGALDICGFPRGVNWMYRNIWAGKDDRPKDEQTGQETAIMGELDRASIRADGEDVAVVNIRVADAKGLRSRLGRVYFTVTLKGPGKVLSLANGNDQNHEVWDTSRCETFDGQAQILVQSTREAGTITLEVKSDGLTPAIISIPTSPCTPRPWVP